MYLVNGWRVDAVGLIYIASALAGVKVLGLAPAMVLLWNKGFDVKEVR